MSSIKARELFEQFTATGSAGGSSIYAQELRKIADEIKKEEPGDQVRGGKRLTVDESEAALWAEVGRAKMSAGARRLYGTLSAELDGLKQTSGPGPGPGDAKPLTSANAKKPVFVNAAGWPTATSSITGQPNNADAEEGFYRFALLVSQRQGVDGKIPALASFTLAEKVTLVENTISMANRSLGATGGRLDGLTADETSQLRSSAFTVLYQISKDLGTDAASARLKSRAHQAMFDLADKEPNPNLGKHMVRVLDRPEYKSTITGTQRTDVESLFAEKIPQKFDVANIMSADGYLQWDHLCGQGEGFLRSFIANLPKQSVNGAQFKEISSSWSGAEFELKFPQGRGENGRIKGIRIKVREFNDDMFDGVGSGRGFSYGGHSNIGQNQEASIARALARGLRADKPQLCLLDLCAGLDNLDDNLKKLGNLEVLTTFGSSFFWKGQVTDSRGTFEGVTNSEGMKSLMALFTGLTAEEGYEGLRKRVSDSITSWSHERNPNVVFPTLTDYREVRWAHLDGDGDGRMDANDVLFQFGLKEAVRDGANEFALKRDVAYDEVRGDALKDAVLDLNVATHYNERMSENQAVEHKFIGGGYFDGSDTHELFRYTPTTNHDGKSAVEVTANHGLHPASREAMGAANQYSSVMWMADTGKIQGLDEVERKLMGLAFATFRLSNDGLGRSEDQRIWKQLLQVMRLPADLPYGTMQSLVDAEHHDYSGNIGIVNQYKQSLTPAQLTALASREVGRPGSGPPVQPIS